MNFHIPTGEVTPATPLLYINSALDFDFDPDPVPPRRWLDFLHQLWDGDEESIGLLQEFFGYCLTPDTSLQKMLLMVGPRRAGKGTIGFVLTHLVGASNVVAPTTGHLSSNFGLQPLIGKPLAIVSDARFSGSNRNALVERLLCISGEDAITIDRKFKEPVTMRLPTRFMFLTNELPSLTDASSALSGRFMILRLVKSFYDKEDKGLRHKLLKELPGILKWSVDGWLRLHERGRFVQPESVSDMVQELEDLSSPVGAFVRQRCVVSPDCRVQVDTLFGDWRRWCDAEGRQSCGTKASFGRELHAAVGGIKRRRTTGDVAVYQGIGLKEAAA
jgi:putative DNA primase/helicase